MALPLISRPSAEFSPFYYVGSASDFLNSPFNVDLFLTVKHLCCTHNPSRTIVTKNHLQVNVFVEIPPSVPGALAASGASAQSRWMPSADIVTYRFPLPRYHRYHLFTHSEAISSSLVHSTHLHLALKCRNSALREHWTGPQSSLTHRSEGTGVGYLRTMLVHGSCVSIFRAYSSAAYCNC